jgi:hypothetical protein
MILRDKNEILLKKKKRLSKEKKTVHNYCSTEIMNYKK